MLMFGMLVDRNQFERFGKIILKKQKVLFGLLIVATDRDLQFAEKKCTR